jgi:uncharacterized protein YqfA (UPF0365 family)
MDYYNMNNIIADTQMRQNIAKTGPGGLTGGEPRSGE